MALLRLDHVPETVKVNLPLYIILPDPSEIGGISVAKRKVLYLLHGLSDDGSAWQRYAAIETSLHHRVTELVRGIALDRGGLCGKVKGSRNEIHAIQSCWWVSGTDGRLL